MKTRDVELLSAYLDSALTAAETQRLETRLEKDAALRATLESLRETRAALRRLPRRRAPRNFTLSPRLVAQRPPLPRAYPWLQWGTALAMMLFFVTLTFNLMLGSRTAAPSEMMPFTAAEMATPSAPALRAAPPEVLAPAQTPTPQVGILSLPATPEVLGMGGLEEPTELPPQSLAEITEAAPTLPAAKETGGRPSLALPLALAALALGGGLSMLILRWWSARQWLKKS